VTTVNLLLLPYAGGGAGAFHDWKARLPSWINPVPLNLPGHGARHGEAVLRDWPSLIDRLAAEIRPYLAQPFAIFGHSMGALVGLELSHAIRERTGRTPFWFGASGCKAPARRDREPDWLTCPEDDVLQELRRLGGTPAEVFASRELLDLVLPTLRADFHLCGTYERSPRRLPLASPLLVLSGTGDKISQVPENLSDWSLEFSGPHRIEMIEGGHFFIADQRDRVVALVESALAEAAGRSRTAGGDPAVPHAASR
jgi:surfactin synthase thioesterase subunit